MCARKKKSADYKAEEEQEQCSRKRPERRRRKFLHGSTAAETKKGKGDKMATYEHLQQRALLQVL